MDVYNLRRGTQLCGSVDSSCGLLRGKLDRDVSDVGVAARHVSEVLKVGLDYLLLVVAGVVADLVCLVLLGLLE